MSKIRNGQDELGGADQVLRIYRSHAVEMPSPELDQRILAMAAAALVPAAPVRRTGWMRYAASVAVVVIGTGLTWRLVNEGAQPGRSSERQSSSESQPAQAPTAPPQAAPPAPPAAAAERARRDQASGGAAPMAEDLPRAAAAPPVATEPAVADAIAPAPVATAVARPQSAPAAAAESLHAESGAAQQPGSAAPAPATRAVAPIQSPAPPPAAKRTAAVSPLDPQVWLQHVRALQQSGHLEEARVSLRELRLRYPQLAIPADLEELLKPGAQAVPAPGH